MKLNSMKSKAIPYSLKFWYSEEKQIRDTFEVFLLTEITILFLCSVYYGNYFLKTYLKKSNNVGINIGVIFKY
jgi:hypothetical protein